MAGELSASGFGWWVFGLGLDVWVFLVADFVGLVNCSLVGVLVSRVLRFGFRFGGLPGFILWCVIFTSRVVLDLV